MMLRQKGEKVTFEGAEELSDIKVEEQVQPKRKYGDCISIDDIGPISPRSSEGYTGFFYAKVLGSNMAFTYLTDECKRILTTQSKSYAATSTVKAESYI